VLNKKWGFDLALQRVQPGFKQKTFLLFQLHLNARQVPDLMGMAMVATVAAKPASKATGVLIEVIATWVPQCRWNCRGPGGQ